MWEIAFNKHFFLEKDDKCSSNQVAQPTDGKDATNTPNFWLNTKVDLFGNDLFVDKFAELNDDIVMHGPADDLVFADRTNDDNGVGNCDLVRGNNVAVEHKHKANGDIPLHKGKCLKVKMATKI